MKEMNEVFRIGDFANKLIIGDTTLSFDYPIQKLLPVSNTIILLLEIPPKTKCNKNVFGVSLIERSIKWLPDRY